MEPTKFRGEATIMKAILELTSKPDLKGLPISKGMAKKVQRMLVLKKVTRNSEPCSKNRNLDVSTIDLSLMNTLPEDAKFVIIADPKGTFFKIRKSLC